MEDEFPDEVEDMIPSDELGIEESIDPSQLPPIDEQIHDMVRRAGVQRPTEAHFHIRPPAHDDGPTDGDFDLRDARARELDLGDDPGDESSKAWWACKHAFVAESVRYPEEHDGAIDRMECHMCWRHVEPRRGPTLRPRRIGGSGEAEAAENEKRMGQAWSCTACGIMYCGSCREDVMARMAAEEENDEVLLRGDRRW